MYRKKSEADEQLSIEEYLRNIRQYLHGMINNLRAWEFHLVMRITLMSTKDYGKKRLTRSKSDNREFMTGFNTSSIGENRFDSFLQWYQDN